MTPTPGVSERYRYICAERHDPRLVTTPEQNMFVPGRHDKRRALRFIYRVVWKTSKPNRRTNSRTV